MLAGITGRSIAPAMLIKDTAPLSVQDRLGIHARGYIAKLVGHLRGDYPMLRPPRRRPVRPVRHRLHSSPAPVVVLAVPPRRPVPGLPRTNPTAQRGTRRRTAGRDSPPRTCWYIHVSQERRLKLSMTLSTNAGAQWRFDPSSRHNNTTTCRDSPIGRGSSLYSLRLSLQTQHCHSAPDQVGPPTQWSGFRVRVPATPPG
jgi:hypothetical protein